MDLKGMMDGAGGQWTDERHALYLDWIEASFVRRVLHLDSDSNVDCRIRGARAHPRLSESDTESTGESPRRLLELTTDNPGPHLVEINLREGVRKRSSSRCDASQDQIVPGL
ncbi:hypothetical protein HPP92_007387 [Vanilla planifolia]|uniref:Uncharacterized protein n=1 Tax=Vanilla planifolia TaxID=51239 RepID=A0A835VA10_VANPL|nr:hypothetical protein HPP92_007387 [Vanilla planifolia]